MVVIRSQISRKFGRSLGKLGNDTELRLERIYDKGKGKYWFGNIWESYYGAGRGTLFINTCLSFIAFKSQLSRGF